MEMQGFVPQESVDASPKEELHDEAENLVGASSVHVGKGTATQEESSEQALGDVVICLFVLGWDCFCG